MRPSELAASHAERFPDGPERTPAAMASRAKALGLRKAEGYKRNPPTFWTPGKREWFASFAPGHSGAEISAEHERLYGAPLTKAQIGNAKRMLGVRSGTVGGRFEKGRTPANKGRPRSEWMPEASAERCRATQFKAGGLPHNTRPLLDTRTTADGYLEIHVGLSRMRKPNDQWIPYARFVWMQANGRDWPEGCRAVHADGDRSNFDPGNIVAVPQELWATIAHWGIEYWDRESLDAAVTYARIVRKRTELAKRPRACRVCGRVFEPTGNLESKVCPDCWKAGKGRRWKRKKGLIGL